MVRNQLYLLASRFRPVVGNSLVILLTVSLGTQATHGLDASNVLVLYNRDSAEGLEIAQYYAQLHPGVSLLALDGVDDAEEIGQEDYLKVIRPQVLEALTDDVQVIVTTKGLPLRIYNDVENPGTYSNWRGNAFNVPIFDDWWNSYSSLESELTRITNIASAEMMGDQANFLSPPTFPFDSLHHAANPYYNANQAFSTDTPGYDGMRLTARLDGFTVDDVIDSLDRAQTVNILAGDQIVVVDDDPDAPGAVSDTMELLVSGVLPSHDQSFIYDDTNADILTASEAVVGYVSHGSHAAGRFYMDDLDFTLADGAVFHTWESYNAYSFREGNNRYGQGLIAEWIESGGTAAIGHVEEPGDIGTRSIANEDILWDMLLQGYTFAEAAWAATPQLSYVNTVVGDPLMRLFSYCMGDVNYDGIVGLEDLHLVLSHWNTNVTDGLDQGDANCNGFIGLDDLDLILKNWSEVDEPPSIVTPEPGSFLLTTFACGIAMLRRR